MILQWKLVSTLILFLLRLETQRQEYVFVWLYIHCCDDTIDKHIAIIISDQAGDATT